jgi:hypothetical protein
LSSPPTEASTSHREKPPKSPVSTPPEKNAPVFRSLRWRLTAEKSKPIAPKKNGDDHQRGAIAVIDTKTNSIKKVIELEGKTQPNSPVKEGINPRLPMVYDSKRNVVIVPSSGERPRDTGLLSYIHASKLEIKHSGETTAGFQGPVVLADNNSRQFTLYHTSTPTDSSHLFSGEISKDGSSVKHNSGTIVDAFDGIDALAGDSSQKVVAMANTCVTGFCVGGSGVNFIDGKADKKQNKLMADEIGFEPSMVVAP